MASHVRSPGRLPALIVDDLHRWPFTGQPDHGAHEVGPVRPVQPRRPHHVGGLRKQPEHGLLAGQLGAPVTGPGFGGGVLGIGPPGVAAEDVVSGYLHHPHVGVSACGGHDRGAASVHPERCLLMRFGTVYRGPGGAVDEHIRTEITQRGPDRCFIGDVQLAPGQRGHAFARPVQCGGNVAAEHATGSGDQPPGHGRHCRGWTCSGAGAAPRACPAPGAVRAAAASYLSGCHQSRLSSYHCTVALSPSANGMRGA